MKRTEKSIMTYKISLVKICGITTIKDALFICKHGIKTIGFVAYFKSKRYVDCETVRNIISQTADNYTHIMFVGVFVDENIDTIIKYIESGINVIQLHGNENNEYILNLKKQINKINNKLNVSNKIEIWKAVRLKSINDIISVKDFSVDKYLLDSYTKNDPGGTGKLCDWKLVLLAKSILNKDIILAGGLNASNIIDAFTIVKPFGVDISSGVEISPGIKSQSLIKEFISNINSSCNSRYHEI